MNLPYAWTRGQTTQEDYWWCEACPEGGTVTRADDTPAVTHTRLTGHATRTIWVTARPILPMRQSCSPPFLSS